VINALVCFFSFSFLFLNINRYELENETCKADVINIQMKFYVFVKVVGGAHLCIQLYIESFMCIWLHLLLSVLDDSCAIVLQN